MGRRKEIGEDAGEIIDSLRLDAEGSSPKERAELEARARDATNRFTQKWGSFIEQPVTPDEVVSSLIILDAETMATVVEDFVGLGPIDPETVPAGSVTTHPEFRMLALLQRHEWAEGFWTNMPQESQAELKDAYGITSDKDAIAKVAEIGDYGTFSHEVAHMNEADSLPIWFKEAGAYYYQDVAMLDSYPYVFRRELHTQRANVYENLVARYGEQVHRLYFGQESKRQGRAILKDKRFRKGLFKDRD